MIPKIISLEKLQSKVSFRLGSEGPKLLRCGWEKLKKPLNDWKRKKAFQSRPLVGLERQAKDPKFLLSLSKFQIRAQDVFQNEGLSKWLKPLPSVKQLNLNLDIITTPL